MRERETECLKEPESERERKEIETRENQQVQHELENYWVSRILSIATTGKKQNQNKIKAITTNKKSIPKSAERDVVN